MNRFAQSFGQTAATILDGAQDLLVDSMHATRAASSAIGQGYREQHAKNLAVRKARRALRALDRQPLRGDRGPPDVEARMIRALTFTTGLGLQGAGLYAAVATFGTWTTLGLYAIGGLVVVLQHVVLRRAPCSAGES